MKRTIPILLLPLIIFLTACGQFLEVDNPDELSGNIFWKTKEDVEGYTMSVYYLFREATMNNGFYMPGTGDFRCAPVFSAYTNYDYVDYLAVNNLNGLFSDRDYATNDKFLNITKWRKMYEVIATSNILHEEVADVSSLSASEISGYQAEAVFMRCMSYFFLVRLFGDVPYYTNAYNNVSLPRTDMVEVLRNCLTDLQAVLDTDPNAQALPWTYTDASKVAVRAMRGGVIALMMHINMWLAGFDSDSKDTYYTNVIQLGEEITGKYVLLPLSQSKSIFAGGSEEGLFEVVQNINAGETFSTDGVYCQYVVPPKLSSGQYPGVFYQSEFLSELYPVSEENDKRTMLWFKNIYADNSGSTLISATWVVKFLNEYTDNSGNFRSNIGNQIIFRYADALLLYAEAAAELGADYESTARELVGQIRSRAGIEEEVTETGQGLKDLIYWERVRELIGEGHYYFDLVRTGKIYNGTYSYNPISRSAFDRGAWTWPIHIEALEQNPQISLNQYWN